MTIDRLREALDSRPFRPFVLHIADGRSLDVHSPEFVARSPSGRTISLYTRDDHHHLLDVLLVTGIEIGNGKGRRRSA